MYIRVEIHKLFDNIYLTIRKLIAFNKVASEWKDFKLSYLVDFMDDILKYTKEQYRTDLTYDNRLNFMIQWKTYQYNNKSLDNHESLAKNDANP